MRIAIDREAGDTVVDKDGTTLREALIKRKVEIIELDLATLLGGGVDALLGDICFRFNSASAHKVDAFIKGVVQAAKRRAKE